MRFLLAALMLAALASLALPTAAAEVTCVPVPGAQACAFVFPPGYVAVGAGTEAGTGAEVSFAMGTGFGGDYIYVIGIVEQQGLVRVHGGVGFVDRNYDGFYEDACVGGATQSFVYVPHVVCVEDRDGDGMPESLYYEPQGVLPIG